MSTISVFASGTGSNFEALADAGLPIAMVVCDHADAPVVAKAQARSIATFIIDYRDYPTKPQPRPPFWPRYPPAT